MVPYILKRLGYAIPTIFGVVALVFFIIHLVPGDPVDMMLGEGARMADREKLRRDLGLHLPPMRQFSLYLGRLVQGDMGVSLHSQRPVASEILDRFPATLKLALASLSIAFVLAIPLGVWSAVKEHSLLDQGALFFSLLAVSMPNFWLGPLLVLFFSVYMGWLPVSGSGTWAHMVLPAVTLGASLSAVLMRMTRTSMREALREDYIRTARAKGLPWRRVIWRHGLKNALLPIVTIGGLQFGALLSGAMITETIFSWPGIGRLTVQALNTRDYPLAQGCVLFIALCYVLVNLATDIVYAFIDPRVTND